MNREEEIQKAAKIFYASSDDYTVYKKGFEAGATYADQHTRKGLWDSEKVIEWMKQNYEQYIYNYGIDEVIVGLRKAMED